MLFEPDRHEALAGGAWDERAVRRAIEAIAGDALARFDPSTGWPAHPLDEPEWPDQRFWMLYFGAGGVIWALERMRRLGAVPFERDFTEAVVALPDRNRLLLERLGNGTASYLFGDAGLLLLQWQFTRDPGVADRLFSVVDGNIEHPSREALWGSPGTVLAALHMAESSGETRWTDLFARAMTRLRDQMVRDDKLGAWLWVQDLYGKRERLLGAGHGFAGNVYPALRGAALLPRDVRGQFEARALETLDATAAREAGHINWPPLHDPEGKKPPKWVIQDCHGAPGIICRVAQAPASPAWNALLLGAGELVWRAGPLSKGPGLCHGTAGNGYAFLKLYKRTGDALWLERARAFAMHAIAQVEQARARFGQGRYSLWTGDPGVALFAMSCIAGDADFPTLDVF